MQTDSPRSKPLRGKLTVLVVRLALLAGSLVLLFHLVDISRLIVTFRRVTPAAYLLAIGIAVSRCWLVAMRWRLLNSDPTTQLNRWQYFRYVMLSNTFNLFMPGSLGGDVIRSILVLQEVDSQRGANLLAIVVDRVIGLASILILGSIACLAAPTLPERWRYLLMFTILIVGFLLAIGLAVSNSFHRGIETLSNRLGPIGQKALQLLGSWQAALVFYRSNPRKVLFALLLCLPIHIAWFLVVFVLSRSIGVNLSLWGIGVVTSLSWVVTAFPLTISGLGVRELSFVYLLSFQGVAPDPATALSVCSFSVTVLLGVLGAPFILLGRLRTRGRE